MERAKLGAERACWDEILTHQAKGGSDATRLTTILPYFISGPPLYKEAFNSSCNAINSILNGSQYGFPNVHLPMTDVRDVAAAHVVGLTDHYISRRNGRYLMSTQSIWFQD